MSFTHELLRNPLCYTSDRSAFILDILFILEVKTSEAGTPDRANRSWG